MKYTFTCIILSTFILTACNVAPSSTNKIATLTVDNNTPTPIIPISIDVPIATPTHTPTNNEIENSFTLALIEHLIEKNMPDALPETKQYMSICIADEISKVFESINAVELIKALEHTNGNNFYESELIVKIVKATDYCYMM